MKVLWLAVTPSLYDEGVIGGWIASLEKLVKTKCKWIDLAIAFEHSDRKFKVNKDGVDYYPINIYDSFLNELKVKLDYNNYWRLLRTRLLKIVHDSKPDIIHCFGSEWPFGAIVNDVDIPVVIHMQGFRNIYNYFENQIYPFAVYMRVRNYNPKGIYSYWRLQSIIKKQNSCELMVMKNNRYFMGRTNWDKNIVHFYSKNAKYYYCPEAIREDIYMSNNKWKFEKYDQMKLITITQASSLKGNEIILRTAQFLKEHMHFNFEWRITGNKQAILMAEKKTGIKHQNVNVTLLGLINSTQIIDELLSAEVYVHPAIIDNSPNSLCEAQLVGCPVIAANVGGISNIVNGGTTGFLYPYNEYHSLAFILMQIHNDEKLLTSISKQEITESQLRHNPDNIIKHVFMIYDEIINDWKTYYSK